MWKKNEAVVKYLIEHGADVHKENKNGHTPSSFTKNKIILNYLHGRPEDYDNEVVLKYFPERTLFS